MDRMASTALVVTKFLPEARFIAGFSRRVGVASLSVVRARVGAFASGSTAVPVCARVNWLGCLAAWPSGTPNVLCASLHLGTPMG